MRESIGVSLVIPCYNCEKYLDGLLMSLVNQTAHNFEVICVNDGSTDNTKKILEDYAKKHKFIKVMSKKNGGQYKARKDGIFAAKGEYIGFLDSDDKVKPEYVEKLYRAVTSKKADIAVCGYSRINAATGKLIVNEMCNPRHKTIYPQKNPGLLLEVNSAIWNKIFRAELVKNNVFFETAPKGYEDMVLLQYVYRQTEKIVFVEESLYDYMIIETSTINNIKKELVQEMYAALTDIRKKYVEEKLSDDFMYYADANAFLHLGISIPFRLLTDKTANFSKVLKEITAFLDKNNPLWRNNKYIKLSYIHKNKGTNRKLFIVQKIYKMHMMKCFLKTYNFVINKFNIDIKW